MITKEDVEKFIEKMVTLEQDELYIQYTLVDEEREFVLSFETSLYEYWNSSLFVKYKDDPKNEYWNFILIPYKKMELITC